MLTDKDCYSQQIFPGKIKLGGTMKIDNLALLTRLLEFQSTSGNEFAMVSYMSEILSTNHVSHILDEIALPIEDCDKEKGGAAKRTANIYAVVGDRQAQSEESLVLYAHTDVVTAPEWQFIPKTKDGKLYARGSSDMKAALSGLMAVLCEDYDVLSKAGKPIVFAFIADEEAGSAGAMRLVEWMRAERLQDPRFILMEPSEDFSSVYTGENGYISVSVDGKMKDVAQALKSIVDNKDALLAKYNECAAGKIIGHSNIQVTKVQCQGSFDKERALFCQGLTCHASDPDQGVNALEDALLKYKDIYAILTPVEEARNSIPSQAWFYITPRPEERLQCTGYIDIRVDPKVGKYDELFSDVKALLGEQVKVATPYFGKPSMNPDKGLVEMCKYAAGTDIPQKTAKFSTDAATLSALTPNIISAFGPGDVAVAHKSSEYVSIDAVNNTPEVIRRLICAYLSS